MTSTHNPTPATSDPKRLLDDPTRVTVSVAQAAAILGIHRSTAHAAYTKTGNLTDGVPVLRVGKRVVVSVIHLRRVLGLPDPVTAA
jgi:hypothetical protein